MIEVDEAIERILPFAQPLSAVKMGLEQSQDHVLAKDVPASMDSPPFDKSMMDGFAVDVDMMTEFPCQLDVVETVTAGRVPEQRVSAGKCIRIMTGAQIPAGANAVIPIEQVDFDESVQTISLTERGITRGKHILERGTNRKAGEPLVRGGTKIAAQHIGTFAEFGIDTVQVTPLPSVAVLATGDELRPYAERELPPGTIRNSNEPMLFAQVLRALGRPFPLGVARDDREVLKTAISKGLESNVLILSGGVSAGKLDLVPRALADCDVREVFHKVRVKPGKPVWFGVREVEGQAPQLVFGLPGNPVSSMVCFEIFVRPALARLAGRMAENELERTAIVRNEFAFRSDRPTYHPVHMTWDKDHYTARIVKWTGSSDLAATAAANAMARFEPGERVYQPGERLTVTLWDTPSA